MAIINVNGISGINSITAQSGSLNFYTAAGNTLSIGASVSGNITGNVTGNINSSGVSTFNNVVVGGANTTLIVNGNARITGILTVGSGTITINPATDSISGVTTAGITTVYTNSINGGQLGGSRNIIINGSMVVNQRGFTGVAGTSTSLSYGVDRFILEHSQDGVVSAGQTTLTSTTGGDAYADGFQNAHILRVTTADASLGAAQYLTIAQTIEGYNAQGIKKGTANAQPVTLSFWCRSTTTGTYIIDLTDHTNLRQVSQAYTINAANTWEKKVLTYPADTSASGVLANDNSKVMSVNWFLAAGSSLTSGTLNTSWAASTNANRAVGQTNLLATAGNNFWLTGVQLEVGDRATEFERRSYGQELHLCERYYQIKEYNGGTVNMYPGSTNGYFTIPLSPLMRTAPSVITYDTAYQSSGFIFYNGSSTAVTYGNNQPPTIGAVSSVASRTSGNFSAGEVCGHTYVRIRASAEL